MRIRKISSFLIIVLISIAFVMTSGTTGCGGSLPEGTLVPAGGFGGEAASDDTTTTTTIEAADSPVASLPLPAVFKASPIIFTPDAEQNYPIDGPVGAIEDFEAGDLVMFDVEEIDVAMTCNEKDGSLVRGFAGSWRIKEAVAEETGCDNAFAIEEDGSFMGYAYFDDISATQLYMAVVDPDTCEAKGDASLQYVQSNMRWLASAATDLIVKGNDVNALTENVVVQASIADDGALRVDEDYEDGYGLFGVDGTKLIYDIAYDRNYFGVMNTASTAEGGGVHAHESDGTDTGIFGQVDDADEYTMVKSVYGSVYYSVKKTSDTEAYIYDLYDGIPMFLGDLHPLNYNHVQLLYENVDSEGNPMRFSQIFSFDADETTGYFAAVYEDIEGNVRVRMTNHMNMFGGETPLTGVGLEAFDIKDLVFYDTDKFLLLDAANDAVYTMTVDFDNETVPSTIEATNTTIVGDYPVAIALNEDKDRAYVLNANDETVSIIGLTNDDEAKTPLVKPQVLGTKSMSDYIDGALSVTFEPNLISVGTNDLYVGSQGINGFLAMSKEEITEAAIVNEDLDGDGYDKITDCDDNNPDVHPAAFEYCGDEIDNNCDGQVDEDTAEDADTWYPDNDGDDYGVEGNTTVSCTQPEGFADNTNDCDDADATVYPGAIEACDDVDNDCNGLIDDDAPTQTWYGDKDRDGYGNPAVTKVACSPTIDWWVLVAGDCADQNPAVNPGATEDCSGGVDNDCDGDVDEGSTEICDDDIDNDCDGYTDLADSECVGGL